MKRLASLLMCADKGSISKDRYHDGRAFWKVSAHLRKLAAEK